MSDNKLADVQKEYEKDSKLKKEDVDSLKEWAEKRPHLPKITDLQYILFLQSCYFSNEHAKSTIENYFAIRTMCKDIFSNANPKDPAIQMSLDVGLVSVLPNVTPLGYKVVFMKLLDTNPDKYILLDEIRTFDMIVTLEMHVNGTNQGVAMVFDMAGAVFGHLLKFNPVIAKKYLFYVQEALPVRLKEIHIINAPTWMDKLLALVKPLMKKELYDMINIHTTIDTFYKYVPKEILPKDYGGGSCGPSNTLGEINRKNLEGNTDFFQHQANQLIDEFKRTDKSTDYDKIFGLEGTFKKLEVD